MGKILAFVGSGIKRSSARAGALLHARALAQAARLARLLLLSSWPCLSRPSTMAVAPQSLGRHQYLMHGGWVYIMTNRPNGTLYLGVTSELVRRVWEHREGVADGFTKCYGLKRLVWFERHEDIRTGIQREKTMKHWAGMEGAVDRGSES